MGVPAERIVFTTDEEGGSQGCKELMDALLRHASGSLPTPSWRLRVDKEAKISAVYAKDGKAKAIIATAVTTAVGVSATPIPCLMPPSSFHMQVTMIGSLAALYGLKAEAIKQSALPFVARLGRMFLANLLKFIPFLGNAINATVMAPSPEPWACT